MPGGLGQTPLFRRQAERGGGVQPREKKDLGRSQSPSQSKEVKREL